MTLYEQMFSVENLREEYENKISDSKVVGRDGVTQENFKNKLTDEITLVIKKVGDCTYKFTTYKQKLISKGPNRFPRVISISTIRDRLVLRVLNGILVKTFSEAIIKKPHVIIKNISKCLANESEEQVFVRIDIKDFFPSINREILFKQIEDKISENSLKSLIQNAIKNKTEGLDESSKGIPQGLSISNMLSSINLMKMDQKLNAKYQYFRYVDDILVICKKSYSQEVFDEIKKELCALGLICHELDTNGKSSITEVSEGVDYLGFSITKNDISVRQSSYMRMFEKLLSVLTSYKHTNSSKRNEKKLIWQLNIKITGCLYKNKRFGWMFFFSQINNERQLGRLDAFLDRELCTRSLDYLQPKIKKFIRSYHEIRNNLRQTSYIKNFDKYNVKDMIQELVQAGENGEEYYRDLDNEKIEKEFHKLIKRQTKRLEKDLIELRS